MNQKKFSIVASLRFGFYTVVDNIVFFLSLQSIIALILIAAFFIIGGMLYLCFPTEVIALFKSITENNAEIGKKIIRALMEKSYFMAPVIIFCILSMNILYRYLMLGLVRISFDFYDHHTSQLNRLFGSLTIALKAFVASLLYNLMIVLGTLLFVIPGIIAAIRFSLYQQVLLDQNVSIIDSLKISARLTKGSTLRIFGLNLIFGLINISAYFTFGITYIITIPALCLAQTYIYRKLLASPATTNA